ncbi:PepSY domain-containing protein, partial [Sphingobacterium multivorum]|uniref:PepSY domain-containing protein n=1 Tax=Sphingobacterium multivorum TaxID=28454 RepID=UPI00369F772A
MFKTVILWLHKWLGIITGVVVFILSLTGSIYTFQDELKLWAYPEKYFISDTTIHSKTPLPLSTLLDSSQKSLKKNQKITRVDLYPSKNRTWVFRFFPTFGGQDGAYTTRFLNKSNPALPYICLLI